MSKPSKEFEARFSAAKRWRQNVEPTLREIYSFCCPGRENDFNRSRYDQSSDVTNYHSLGEEVATDLAGDLVTYFTPAEERWANYVVTAEIEEDAAEAVLALVQDREDKLFELIGASNYNDVAPQWAFEAAAHGTPAIWVSKGHISHPIFIESVPAHELYITPGYMGILDRFRAQWVNARDLEPLLDGWDANLSDPKIRAAVSRNNSVKVVWGFWVDWSDLGRPMWKMEITVQDIRVSAPAVTLGDLAGSCPLLVGRFNPQPGKPWGRGAGWKALPDLRVLDKIDEIVLTAMDDALQTTLIYPDDGFLDLSDGIVPGTAYPASRGFSREHIYELQKGTNLDYGFYSEERLESRIRTAFYQDGPRQRGETPPTAAQWLDERRRVQQRLGKPSAPLWTEMIFPLVQRIEYLAVEAGEMADAITHDGRTITVSPINPMQKAQNQDQVMTARSNLDLGVAAMGPENLMQVIDLASTFKNIIKTSGDRLTVVMEAQNEPTAPPAE